MYDKYSTDDEDMDDDDEMDDGLPSVGYLLSEAIYGYTNDELDDDEDY